MSILHYLRSRIIILLVQHIIFNVADIFRLPGPPTEVRVEQVSVDTVSVSWNPPFTLEGVSILHYTVYITSSTGSSEAVNATQTEISLQRPCADTTYQVSAWSEVGEGNTSSPVTYSRGE